MASNVTPTPFLFLHTPCVPDLIPLFGQWRKVSERQVSVVKKGEKDKIRTNTVLTVL
jgi:hypothetical protein